MSTVLAILPEGFEELEAIAPIDVLRRAGVEVTVASLGDNIHVTGRCGVTIHADTTLSTIIDSPSATPSKFHDMLFLPGGPGVKHLRSDSRVATLVRAYSAKHLWLAAICAAPTVLNDARLLEGRKYTAHFSVASELPAILAHERVVVDGKIITSRGAGTALDFGLVLVEKLTSATKAAEVHAAICA